MNVIDSYVFNWRSPPNLRTGSNKADSAIDKLLSRKSIFVSYGTTTIRLAAVIINQNTGEVINIYVPEPIKLFKDHIEIIA
jgi:hypothetical protein